MKHPLGVLSLALLLAACGQTTPAPSRAAPIQVLSIPAQVPVVTLTVQGADASTAPDSGTFTATVTGGVASFNLPNLTKGAYTLTARGYDNADQQVALYKGVKVVTFTGAPIDLHMNRLTSALTVNVTNVGARSSTVLAKVNGLEARLLVTGGAATGSLPSVPTGRGLNVLVEGREMGALRQQGSVTTDLGEADGAANVTLADVQAAAPATPVLTGAAVVKRGVPYTLTVGAQQDASGGDSLKQLTVSWGDGSQDTRALTGASATLTLQHTFTAAGAQNLSVTVTNTAGLQAQGGQALTVQDAADGSVTVDVGADVTPVPITIAGVDPGAQRVVANIDAPVGALTGQRVRPQDLKATSALELAPRGGGQWGGTISLPAGFTYTLRAQSVAGGATTSSQPVTFVADGHLVSATFNDAANQQFVNTAPGAQLTVPLARLHPTQKAVGYDEVAYKLGRYALDPAKKFDDYCQAIGAGGVKSTSVTAASTLANASTYTCKDPAGKNTADMKTAVVGPGGQLFLTDGHHTYTSFWEVPDGGPNLNARVIVTDNFSALSELDFWVKMNDLHKVWLKDEANQPITPAQLPGRLGLASMTNDPYRSLVYFTRGIAYTATTTEFNEFYWGDWLRAQPGFTILDGLDLHSASGYASAVQRAANLMVALHAGDFVSGGQTAADLGKLDAFNSAEFTALTQPLGSSKPGKLAYMLDYKAKNGL